MLIISFPPLGNTASPGANLLSCSNNLLGWLLEVGATLSGNSVSFTSANNSDIAENVAGVLLPNTTYTLSGLFQTANISFVLGWFDGTTRHVSAVKSASGSRQSFTFTTPASINTLSTVFVANDQLGHAGSVTVQQMKLEVGGAPTAYTGDTSCVLPNLLADCSTFNTSNWVDFGGISFGSLVADPNGVVDAQQVTFTDPRCGFYQVPTPTLQPNTTYTASIYYQLISGTPNFYIGYYNGSSPVTQYSPKIIPTGSWQRTSFTFTTGANDVAPSVTFTNANVDGAFQGNDGVVALWGSKLEIGPNMTAFQGCKAPPPGGRQWAFMPNEGNNNSHWTQLNSGWAKQPIDGVHGFTDNAGGFYAPNGFINPTPVKMTITIQMTVPGVGGALDMGTAANGGYNAGWLSKLQGIANGQPAGSTMVAVRIWQEINGNWDPWSVNQTGSTGADGTAAGQAWPIATIKSAWNNMATQVRSVWPHAVIDWNLAGGGPWTNPTSPGNGTGLDLYPGDTNVDVISIDFYEESGSFAFFKSTATVNLDAVSNFAKQHNKFFGITEGASSGCDTSWVSNNTTYLDNLGISAAYYWWYDQHTTSTEDIIYNTTDPGSCPGGTNGTLRDAFNASSFGQKAFGGTWYPRAGS